MSSVEASGAQILRGGMVAALGTRWMCTNSSSSNTSGTPMWMNESSENSRSFTLV